MKAAFIPVLLSIVFILGCAAPARPQVFQAPPPATPTGPVIVYFYSTPACSTCADNVTLTWQVTGADTVSIDQGIGPVAAADNLTVAPTVTTTYTLSAAAGSRTAADSTTVVVTPKPTVAAPVTAAAPTVTYFDTTPTAIAPGDIITLVWQTQGATSVTISNGIGQVGPAGRYSVTLYASTPYTLTATNPGGSVTAQLMAAVEEPGNNVTFLPVQSSMYNDVQAVVGASFTIGQDWNNQDGYAWSASYYDPTAFQYLGSSYEAYNPPYRGVNGQEQFTFKPLKEGDFKLMLSYYNKTSPVYATNLYYVIHVLAP